MADIRQSRIQSFAFVIAVSVCVLFCSYFLICGLSGRGELRNVKVESRINPNNASTASLVRLPQIGPSRAAAIIAYRKSISSRAAFRNCDDLRRVKGIGPKTVKNLREWLKFE